MNRIIFGNSEVLNLLILTLTDLLVKVKYISQYSQHRYFSLQAGEEYSRSVGRFPPASYTVRGLVNIWGYMPRSRTPESQYREYQGSNNSQKVADEKQ